MSGFKKGLSAAFVQALAHMAAQPASWWRDILDDEGLIIAVRDEYLNVYWQGQSLFLIKYGPNGVTASTHPKYLIDPDLSGQINCDLEARSFGPLPANALISTYEGPFSLRKMKRAAELFSGDEKRGVHRIATENASVVDVEFALNTAELPIERKLPRVDIVAFEKQNEAVELVFWEAKLFVNKELRAKSGPAHVVGQIKEYQIAINHFRHAILQSYENVASNLSAIVAMSNGARRVSQAVQAVAEGDLSLTMSAEPRVGLIVYGYDGDQKKDGSIWSSHLRRLEEDIGKVNVRARGEAKGLKL